MSVSFARPDVSELVFHIYERTLHPELFTIHGETVINQEQFTAIIRICDTGHVVSFQSPGQTITELLATRKQPLPRRKRFVDKRLRGHCEESHKFDSGVEFHFSYQLEQLDPEIYLNLHEELLIDSTRAVVSHRFPGGNRLAPCPISLIQTDVWPQSLLVHTFHTFPENCAVVKTQSLFEICSE